jgi:hypothetical protein
MHYDDVLTRSQTSLNLLCLCLCRRYTEPGVSSMLYQNPSERQKVSRYVPAYPKRLQCNAENENALGNATLAQEEPMEFPPRPRPDETPPRPPLPR